MPARRTPRTGTVLFILSWLAACVCGGFALPAVGQQTLYVSAEAGDDAWSGGCAVHDGASCGPKRTLQAAFAVAQAQDTLLIAPGVYAGPGNRDLQMVGRGLTLRSTDGPAGCVIDCEAAGSALRLEGEPAGTLIEGITFRNGRGGDGGAVFVSDSQATFRACRFEDNHATGYGGAVYKEMGQTLFEACTFTGNSAQQYAGAFYGLTLLPDAIADCVFEHNSAQGQGGAVCYFADSPTDQPARVQGCTFSHNDSATEGGALAAAFGGLHVTDCLFAENTAGSGGAVSGVHKVSRCQFHRNSAAYNGGAAYDVAQILNSTFIGNRATGWGGAVYSFREIVNCTIFGNSAGTHGGLSKYSNPTYVPEVVNSIVWGNTTHFVSYAVYEAQLDPKIVVHHSVVSGAPGRLLNGTGYPAIPPVSGANPLFADPVGPDGQVGSGDEDLRLMTGSPCLDAGDNTAVPADEITDLAGDPRFYDVPGADDIGNPGTPGAAIVDLGAYEIQSPAPLPTPRSWLVNADGGGDFASLTEAAAAAGWGDEIILAPGTYDEPQLWIGKLLHLRGSSSNPMDTVIRGSVAFFGIGSTPCELANLSLQGILNYPQYPEWH